MNEQSLFGVIKSFIEVNEIKNLNVGQVMREGVEKSIED